MQLRMLIGISNNMYSGVLCPSFMTQKFTPFIGETAIRSATPIQVTQIEGLSILGPTSSDGGASGLL